MFVAEAKQLHIQYDEECKIFDLVAKSFKIVK